MALRLNGATSGFVELNAPDEAGSNTLTLPNGNGSSGQYLQTNGSGGLSWATPAAGGTILSSGIQTGNGGTASGNVLIDSFTGLDFSAATADSRLMVMARTCMQETSNTSNVAFIQVRINAGGSNEIPLCCARNGATHGTHSSSFLLEISTHTIQAIAATYRTTNVNLLFRAEINGGSEFRYGQPGYTAFDDQGAGYNFSYALFSE